MSKRRPPRALDRVQLPEDAGGHVGFVTQVRLFGPPERPRRMLTVVTPVGVALIEAAHVRVA